MASDSQQTQITEVWVSCGSHRPVEESDLHSFVIDQDLDQPDMCVITLRNAEHTYSNNVEVADEVEVRIGGQNGEVLFQGEVVGVEPLYKTGGETRCVVRAFNRLHRLLRGRKSRTFLDKSDSDIASQIAGDHGLRADTESTGVTHSHVYQHNQTDFELLRICAARNGYDVRVEDRNLIFKPSDPQRDSGIELELGDPDAAGLLKAFSPRMSTAGIAQTVEVRAWNPDKKEEVVGRAEAGSSSLGQNTGAKKAEKFGSVKVFTVDHPVESVDEANKLAQARLGALMMDYITGDGVCVGKPEIKPGVVIKITVNPQNAGDRFNGKYMVVGTSHRYSYGGSGGGQEGGYTTAIRVRRDAEGGS